MFLFVWVRVALGYDALTAFWMAYLGVIQILGLGVEFLWLRYTE